MALWKRLWILFSAIWIVVAALQVVTILAIAEGAERDKAVLPLVLGLGVPAAAYAIGWLWERWRKARRR